jgi:hypothetical protein
MLKFGLIFHEMSHYCNVYNLLYSKANQKSKETKYCVWQFAGFAIGRVFWCAIDTMACWCGAQLWWNGFSPYHTQQNKNGRRVITL